MTGGPGGAPQEPGPCLPIGAPTTLDRRTGRTGMGLKIASLSTPKERTPQRLSLCMIMRDEEEHLAAVPRERPGRRGRGRDRGHRFGRPLGGDRRVVRGARPARGVEGRLRRAAQHRHRRGDRGLDPDPRRRRGAGRRGQGARPAPRRGRWRATASARSTSSARSAGIESVVNSAFRLFRNRPAYRYSGALHEQIMGTVDPRAAAARASSGSRSTTTATSSRPAGPRRRPTATWRS